MQYVVSRFHSSYLYVYREKKSKIHCKRGVALNIKRVCPFFFRIYCRYKTSHFILMLSEEVSFIEKQRKEERCFVVSKEFHDRNKTGLSLSF